MAIKVGFQGVKGSFSEQATRQYFKGEELDLYGYATFAEVLEKVESGELEYGMLPVENTTTGIIARTYDLFSSYNIYVVGELSIPIDQNLIVLPGTKLEDIREVYSHPEALSQCQKFFDEHLDIIAKPYTDTAESVAFIKEENNKAYAALASTLASEYYGMEILLPAIQDNHLNRTRFLCITNKEEYPKDANKISLKLILNHRPGALYNALGIISKCNINLIKLESRPIPGEIFKYMFYMDFEGNLNNREVKSVLKELSLRSIECKIFGNYKQEEIENL